MHFRVLGIAVLLLPGAASCSRAPGVSVCIVTLDTTRADRLGCYGRADAGTPHLDALAARGVRFDSAHTTAPMTLPAHTSLFTGALPIHSGVRDNGFFELPDGETTLAELARAAGMRTGAFVSAFPVYRPFGLDQGFETYDHPAPIAPGNPFAEDERAGGATTDAALAWLDELAADDRFLLWLHLFDPHLPYRAPEPFATRFPEDPYQAEIAYADACVGRLIDRLERDGRLERTLVFALGDHGEAFGERNEIGHGSLIHANTTRIPLLVAGPGVPAGRIVSRAASITDVLPTVAALVRLPVPRVAEGVSLATLWSDTAQDDERAVYIESVHPRLNFGWSDLAGVVQGGWKYVEAPRSGRPGELYDLTSDPQELDDAAAREPERARELSLVLADLLATAIDEDRAARAPSADELASLARLGYVDADAPVPASGGGTLPHPRAMLSVYADVTRAREALAAGDASSALRHIERAVAVDPDGYVVQEMLGEYWSAVAAGDAEALRRSAEHFARAAAKNPANPVPWVNLARCHQDLGEYAEALSVLRDAARLVVSDEIVREEDERLFVAAKLHARELERIGREQEAEALWEALIEHRPEAPGPRSRLAELRAGS